MGFDIAALFAWIIKEEYYENGDFMCWAVETVCDDGVVPDFIPASVTENDILAEIRTFMSALYLSKPGFTIDEEDGAGGDITSYALSSILYHARLEVKRERGRIMNERDDRECYQVCFNIYSDWNNRFAIANAYIDQGHVTYE